MHTRSMEGSPAISDILRLLGEGLLELLYPTKCAGCDEPGHLVCDECRLAIAAARPECRCRRCGAPLPGAAQSRRDGCGECSGRTLPFEAAICVGALERPLSRVISVYKDAGERRLAAYLAGLLVAEACDWAGWPDVVTWVPATRAAVARRGFDQSQLLAQAVAEEWGVECRRLLRVHRTKDQRRLGRADRLANVRGAFIAIGDRPPPARVLLVDDVMTTGATLTSAAEALHTGGVGRVRVANIARKLSVLPQVPGL